jgi:hypothetical protein
LTLRRRDEAGAVVDDLAYSYEGNRLGSVADAVESGPGWDAFSSGFAYDAAGNLKSQAGRFVHIDYDHRNLPVRFEPEGGGPGRLQRRGPAHLPGDG